MTIIIIFNFSDLVFWCRIIASYINGKWEFCLWEVSFCYRVLLYDPSFTENDSLQICVLVVLYWKWKISILRLPKHITNTIWFGMLHVLPCTNQNPPKSMLMYWLPIGPYFHSRSFSNCFHHGLFILPPDKTPFKAVFLGFILLFLWG